MAKTIAIAYGYDSSRVKEVHRLGSTCAQAQANTWRTFTTCEVRADGSGFVRVVRDGEVVHKFEFEAERKLG